MANRWRVAALVLGPVVVGLAAWIVIDKTTSSSAGSNQGSALIDEFNAAVSRNDAEATLNTLSSDALFWSNGETFGPTDLRRKIATSSTLTLKRDEPVGGTGGYSFTFA